MTTLSIGQYIFNTNHILGHGSFSIIYKGLRTTDNTVVAIKKIYKIVSLQYIKNEINIMKSLDHPNIAKLYDVIYENHNNKVYIILEYCNGGDLSKYISKKRNKYDNKYFQEILEGMKYLYDNNIMHRDIKPANFLIHNHSIKITDFGFAKSFEQNELYSTFCGSLLYMSPEILKNQQYTYNTDLWSLGVILYELIVKEHPYYVTDRVQLLHFVNKGYNINFTKINNFNYRNIIEKLLQPNYLQRNHLFPDLTQLYIDTQEDKPISIPISNDSPINISPRLSTIEPSSMPLNTHILTDYLEDKLNEIEGTSMPIFGTSPILKPNNGVKQFLNQSVKSISKFFL
jgi:serine/threonine protein kinase